MLIHQRSYNCFIVQPLTLPLGRTCASGTIIRLTIIYGAAECTRNLWKQFQNIKICPSGMIEENRCHASAAPRQRPSLLLEDCEACLWQKVPQAAAWGGCGVRYKAAILSALRRNRIAETAILSYGFHRSLMTLDFHSKTKTIPSSKNTTRHRVSPVTRYSIS